MALADRAAERVRARAAPAPTGACRHETRAARNWSSGRSRTRARGWPSAFPARTTSSCTTRCSGRRTSPPCSSPTSRAPGFMADGVSRRPVAVGVVNVVPGAGVTHCLSGVAEALLDGIPMVVLACGIRRDTGRAFQLHDIDQAAILRPVTKAVLRPERAADIYATVRQAFDLARAGTPGPVAVEIPAEFYLLTHDVAEPLDERPPPRRPRPALAPTSSERRAAAATARAVLLYAGHGARERRARRSSSWPRSSAPRSRRPSRARASFPEHHPLWLWNGLGATVPSPLAHGRRRLRRDARRSAAASARSGTGSYGFTPPPTVDPRRHQSRRVRPERAGGARARGRRRRLPRGAAAAGGRSRPVGRGRRADRERPPRWSRHWRRERSDDARDAGGAVRARSSGSRPRRSTRPTAATARSWPWST